MVFIVETKDSAIGRIVPLESCQLFVKPNRVHDLIGNPGQTLFIFFRDAWLIQFRANTIRLDWSIVVRRVLETSMNCMGSFGNIPGIYWCRSISFLISNMQTTKAMMGLKNGTGDASANRMNPSISPFSTTAINAEGIASWWVP